MKNESIVLAFLAPLAFLLLLSSAIASAGAEEKISPGWTTQDFQFRVLNTTANSGSLWVCGTDETIAVSADNGRHWDVRHQTPDGNSLLNVDFSSDTFGYPLEQVAYSLQPTTAARPGYPIRWVKKLSCRRPSPTLNTGLFEPPVRRCLRLMEDRTSPPYRKAKTRTNLSISRTRSPSLL